MRRSFGVLCVAAALGVGLCWTVYRSVRGEAASRPTTGSAGASRPEDDATPSQVAELRRELGELRRQVWAQGQRAGGEPSRGEAARARDPRTDPEARAEYERARREAIAGVEAGFRGEATDPRWSPAASTAVQAVLAADDKLRSLAREVECRSRTCRVEIADDGTGELDKVLPEFTVRVGQDLSSAVYDRAQGADGVPRRILYLSRPSTPQVTQR
ncbi:MAG TPA: hypothetical protein VF469_01085 [Kofleriaceae bacterium]